jgi:hypothetical protein
VKQHIAVAVRQLLFALSVIAALCIGQLAHATIVLKQTATPIHSSSTAVTISLSGVASGDFLVVFVTAASSTSPTSVTEGSETVNAAIAYDYNSTAGVALGIYYVQNTGGGSITFTVNWATVTATGLMASEYSGVATTSALDQASTPKFSASGSDTITANSLTPSASGELLLALGGGGTFSSWTVVTNEASNSGASPQAYYGDAILANTNAVAPVYTRSANGALMIGTALFTPGAGSSCTHDGWSSAGSFAVPNGSSGSYWLASGAFGTPNCSSTSYWQQSGAFGDN